MNHSMKWGSQQIESEWVIEGMFKRGTINMIAGDPGIGKSFLTLELASRVSRQGGRVLLLSAEDDIGDTIVPRLIAMNADRALIHKLDGFKQEDSELCLLDLGEDLEDLRACVLGIENLALIVFDPISAYMGERAARSTIAAREVLTRLNQIAIDAQCAIVCVTHLEKTKGGNAGTLLRTLDTDVLPAISSTVQIVHEHTRRNQRVVSMVKNDVGNIKLPRVFEIFGGTLNWYESIDDPSRNRFENGNLGFYNRTTKGDEACAFLMSTLASGPRPAREIQGQAKARRLSKNTIERAKKTMGVRSFRKQGVWYWLLGSNRHE